MAVAADPVFRAVRRALQARTPRCLPDAEAEFRAAVALFLSPPDLTPGRAAARDLTPEPRSSSPWSRYRVLVIRRAQVEGDPWAGHAAFPGGRREGSDPDLVETVRRETREEVGLRVARSRFLGRLDDLHPRSPHLPSIAITPYVAAVRPPGPLQLGPEVEGYVWIPVGDLTDPARRASHRLEREGEVDEFPAIDYGGLRIWGLTYEILRQFLDAVGEPGTPGEDRV